jgi:NAD(P)-dependent dehydrogenase (short-subunit alcohol dehydrogenase family)
LSISYIFHFNHLSTAQQNTLQGQPSYVLAKLHPMGFKPSDLSDLSGRVYIVTGGNTGIGYATCLRLAAHNARVYMGARSADKAAKAIALIKESHPDAQLHHLSMDLMSFESVTAAKNNFQKQESRLHGLINNAGIMATPFELSKDGNEAHWQTNYLSHWLLTRELLPLLLETAADPSTPKGAVRIVNTSSGGHILFAPSNGINFKDPSIKDGAKMTRYGQSKLANVLHAKSLNDAYGPGSPHVKAGGAEIWTASLNPGAVDTQMNTSTTVRGMGWLYPTLKTFGVYNTLDEGAISNLFCGASNQFKREWSGNYFGRRAQVESPSKNAKKESLREELERWTEDKMSREGWIN